MSYADGARCCCSHVVSLLCHTLLRSSTPSRRLSFRPRNQLMVSVNSNTAPFETMRLAVAVVDEQDGVRVRGKVRQRDRHLCAAVWLRDEAVRIPSAVDRSKRNRRVVKMVFEEAVMRVRPCSVMVTLPEGESHVCRSNPSGLSSAL